MLKKVLAILAAVLGESIIVALNIILGKELPTEIIILNTVVCTLVYALWMSVYFIKWDKSSSSEGGWVGSLGIKIYGFSSYSAIAILAVIVMNLLSLSLTVQLIVHGVLLFMLLSTFFFGAGISSQVESVAKNEQEMISGIDSMKRMMRKLNDAAFMCSEMNPDLRTLIDDIQQDLRYLSPNKSVDAKELEDEFVEKVRELLPAFRNYRMNEDQIASQLGFLKHLVKNRKQVRN